MKKIYLLLTTLLASFILLGFYGCCGPFESSFSRSYIGGYALIDGVYVYYVYEGGGINISIKPSKLVQIHSTGEDLELYNKICEENNDVTYNNNIWDFAPGIPHNLASYPNFVAIDVVSDTDFDAEHPAGTSLNDLLLVTYSSYYEFIASNYTKPEEEALKDYAAILNSLTADDLRLLDEHGFVFHFIKYPEVLSKHNLTFTFTSADGTTHSTTYVYDFASITFSDIIEILGPEVEIKGLER